MQYNDLIGRKFIPTFSSIIDHYVVRGYDENRKMVLTTVVPKSGSSFDDEIEERYFIGAFETGDYKWLATPSTTPMVVNRSTLASATNSTDNISIDDMVEILKESNEKCDHSIHIVDYVELLSDKPVDHESMAKSEAVLKEFIKEHNIKFDNSM